MFSEEKENVFHNFARLVVNTCAGSLLNKNPMFSPATSLKRGSITGSFLRNLQNFEQLFFKEYIWVSASEKKLLKNFGKFTRKHLQRYYREILQKCFSRIPMATSSEY